MFSFLFFFLVLAFFDFSLLRTHFWPFTEVMRKIPREVTRKVVETAACSRTPSECRLGEDNFFRTNSEPRIIYLGPGYCGQAADGTDQGKDALTEDNNRNQVIFVLVTFVICGRKLTKSLFRGYA